MPESVSSRSMDLWTGLGPLYSIPRFLSVPGRLATHCIYSEMNIMLFLHTPADCSTPPQHRSFMQERQTMTSLLLRGKVHQSVLLLSAELRVGASSNQNNRTQNFPYYNYCQCHTCRLSINAPFHVMSILQLLKIVLSSYLRIAKNLWEARRYGQEGGCRTWAGLFGAPVLEIKFEIIK